jgi:hypothetical protein
VAIVQEVASQLVPGASVPEPEDLLLDRGGVLQLGFGPDTPQNPVAALAALLQALLEGIEAPGGLRTLASDNAGTSPSVTSVESFQRALAFYERPGRAADLEALASRLNAAPGGESPEAEFERLRERLATTAPGGDDEAEDDEAAVDVAAAARKAMPRRMVIVASMLALATVGAIVVYARPRYLAAPSSIADRFEQKLADTISSGLNKMAAPDASASASTAMPAEAPEAANGRAPVTAVRAPMAPASEGRLAGHSTAARANEPLPPVLALRGQLPPTVEGESGLPPAFLGLSAGVNLSELSTAGRPTPPGHVGADGLITYSEADDDVEPPRISRQQLPRKPDPGMDTGYFDVIISETGIVESVQLVSPMRRFQERMLMAAAKAWTFRPAMRDGQPVRYRLRIAIILSDKP